MEPDRFEWLREERQRIAREGAGNQYVKYVYAQNAKRAADIMLPAIPIIFVLQTLPRTAAGPIEPIAALFVGIVLAALSIGFWKWFKPRGLTARYATWTCFGFACLLFLASVMV